LSGPFDKGGSRETKGEEAGEGCGGEGALTGSGGGLSWSGGKRLFLIFGKTVHQREGEVAGNRRKGIMRLSLRKRTGGKVKEGKDKGVKRERGDGASMMEVPWCKKWTQKREESEVRNRREEEPLGRVTEFQFHVGRGKPRERGVQERSVRQKPVLSPP